MFSPSSSSPFQTVADPRPVDAPVDTPVDTMVHAGRALSCLSDVLARPQWSRLSSEYDNPLADLYDEPLKQWQLGFDEAGRCVLIFYDRTAYEGIGEWILAVDGRILHECPDIPQAPASAGFRAHYFSPLATPLSLVQLLQSVCETQWPALVETISLRPEVLGTLKSMLFTMLESTPMEFTRGVGDTPDEAASRALLFKVELIGVFKMLLTLGALDSPMEKQRLKRVIEQVMMSNARLNLLALRSQLMDGIWWLRLQQEAV